MRSLIISIFLFLILVVTPKHAFTEPLSPALPHIDVADIFYAPLFNDTGTFGAFGGYCGGDSNNQIVDWSIGNTIPHSVFATDDIVFSTSVGHYMTPANWFERMRITKEGDIIAQGVLDDIGLIPGTAGKSTRMMWLPGKAAFRAGQVLGDKWDDANVGLWSVAMGLETTASGLNSTAMGVFTTASGQQSTAMGSGTNASEEGSTAMGIQTTASGAISTAMGVQTTASGSVSTAMGVSTTASGDGSTAMGFTTTAESFMETVIGSYNTSYSPIDTNSWNPADRLFVIGNGNGVPADPDERSNAMTVLKNGNVGIGTATPSSQLEVVSTSTSTITATAHNSVAQFIGQAAIGSPSSPTAVGNGMPNWHGSAHAATRARNSLPHGRP